MRIHRGGCHCGAVRFEFDAPADVQASDCNCSICAMTGFQHLIVPAARMRLLQGRDALLGYRFGTGVAEHLFCRHCGIKSFYVPRSNPDGFSINLRCVDPGSIASVVLQPFDGINWERSAHTLAHLSHD
jgi:hypothetical protein